ncbi:MAG: hypothetical protein HY810_09010 [Candidatus Omnitrophica bacterium]|nr:hypothetical protein [Candidatus Omnitrophota bacterium]
MSKTGSFFAKAIISAACLLSVLALANQLTLQGPEKPLKSMERAIASRNQPNEKIKYSFYKQAKTREYSLSVSEEVQGQIDEDILKIKFLRNNEHYAAGLQLTLSVLLAEYADSGALSFFVKMPKAVSGEREIEIYLQELTGRKKLLRSLSRQSLGPEWTEVVVPLASFNMDNSQDLSWEIRNILFSITDKSGEEEELWVKSIIVQKEKHIIYAVF